MSGRRDRLPGQVMLRPIADTFTCVFSSRSAGVEVERHSRNVGDEIRLHEERKVFSSTSRTLPDQTPVRY